MRYPKVGKTLHTKKMRTKFRKYCLLSSLTHLVGITVILDATRASVTVAVVEVKGGVGHGGVGLSPCVEGGAAGGPSAHRMPTGHVVDHDVRVDPGRDTQGSDSKGFFLATTAMAAAASCSVAAENWGPYGQVLRYMSESCRQNNTVVC